MKSEYHSPVQDNEENHTIKIRSQDNELQVDQYESHSDDDRKWRNES